MVTYTAVNVRPATHAAVKRLAKMRGKTMAKLVDDMVDCYCHEHNISLEESVFEPVEATEGSGVGEGTRQVQITPSHSSKLVQMTLPAHPEPEW